MKNGFVKRGRITIRILDENRNSKAFRVEVPEALELTPNFGNSCQKATGGIKFVKYRKDDKPKKRGRDTNLR